MMSRIRNWWVLLQSAPAQLDRYGWHWRAGRITWAVGRDLVQGDLPLYAASLAFTTLLSLVPLLALSFSVLKAMGAHHELTPLLEQFFSPMGQQGIELAGLVLSFVDRMQVGVLGSVGLILLVYTVVALLQKIEHSLNQLWQVPDLRSPGQRFVSYLSVVTVGPLLLAGGVGAAAAVMSNEVVKSLLAIEPFGRIALLLTHAAPTVLICGAFAFVYLYMPNTRVRLGSATVGGLVAGLSWQLAGWIFAGFVVKSAQYEAIYSGFAIGILMMIWAQLTWLILLIGASAAFHHQVDAATLPRQPAVPASDEFNGLRLALRVARHFDAGQGAVAVDVLAGDLRITVAEAHRLVTRLVAGNVLLQGQGADERVMPERSLDRISCWEVLEALRGGRPEGNRSPDDSLVRELLLRSDEATRAAMSSVTLASLVRQG